MCRLERDAQLLANRIALLKQEEMKTWKKIEETKKKTGDILSLKQRNDNRLRKVSSWLHFSAAVTLDGNCHSNLAVLFLMYREFMTLN